MNLSPGPVQPHSGGFFTWHGYDPACKAELWSTGFTAPQETVLFDPIDWPQDSPLPKGLIQIVQTNGNHDRDCRTLCTQKGAVFSNQPAGFTSIQLTGAGEGETAYFHNASGTLVVGDALINLAPHGLMFLPDKYCADPAMLRKNLRRLLDFPVQRIFFAHGDPILQSGQERIQKLFA